MDGKRFDDFARLLASQTDRRGAIKRIAGAAVIGLAAWFRPAISIESATAAPADVDVPSVKRRDRSAPRTSMPGTRPAIKGRHQSTGQATPTVVLTPTSGKIKTAVQAKLTGFRSSEAITLLWFDGTASKTVATGTTSTGGKLTLNFIAPYAFRGYHVVRAVGNRGSQGEARFAINPSFTLKPKSGSNGDTIKASLSGYASKAKVDVYFFPGEAATGTPQKLTSVTLSASGTGSVTFTIPNNATFGLHRIEGREQVSGRLSSAKFNVRECATATDCPESANECEFPVCSSGICTSGYQPAGTATAMQTAGDCKKNVCDGAGGITTINDDADVPDDNNNCTTDTCQNGTVVNTPRNPGEPCGTGLVCSEEAICVGCNVADDCPGADTECALRTCSSNTCGTEFVSFGSTCTGGICDGAGTCTPTVCTPNEIRSCYTGPPSTENVGICLSGSQSCGSDGSGWGPCNGEVNPGTEICNGLDDDCDGTH